MRRDHHTPVPALSDDRVAAVTLLQAAATAAGPKPQTQAWQALADGLGQQVLSDRIDRKWIQALVDHPGKITVAERRGLMRMLGAGSLARYPSATALFREATGKEGPPPPAVTEFLGNRLLMGLDARLQYLYAFYLSLLPDSAAESDDRIVTLQILEPLAYRLLYAAEIPTLSSWLGQGTSRAWSIETFLTRLSAMAFRVKTLNLRITFHCNLRCRHCYNESAPERKGVLKLERLLPFVREARALGIRRLLISGGEPLMYQDTVVGLVREGHQRGIERITIVSNGFVGRRAEDAQRLFERLRDVGFLHAARGGRDNIKVSGGIYHQEFLDFAAVETFCRRYFAVFGRPAILDFEHLPADESARMRVEKRLEEIGLAGMVKLKLRTVKPLGRAAGLDGEFPAKPLDQFGPCLRLDMLAIEPDGRVKPCCGQNATNDNLVFGQMEHADLHALMHAMHNNPLLQFIATRPIGEVFAAVGRRPQATYPGLCSLCQDAIGNSDRRRLFRDLCKVQAWYPFWFSVKRLEAVRRSP